MKALLEDMTPGDRFLAIFTVSAFLALGISSISIGSGLSEAQCIEIGSKTAIDLMRAKT